ncbi:MAG: hypothetical protein GY870_06085, partial [archaeon]|nr:hypothetical protein [archaeon]
MRKLIDRIEGYLTRIEEHFNIEKYVNKYVSIEKYLGLIIKYPKAVLCIITIITVFMFMGLLKLEVDNSLDVIMPKEDEEYISYKKIQEIYGNVGNFILMDVSSDNGLWNQKTFKDIDNLVVDIEEYKKYNEKLENHRLDRFKMLLAGDEIKFKDFLDNFNDDASFQRLIKRKKKKIFHDRDILNKDELEILEKELLRVKEIKKLRRVDAIVSAFTIKNMKGDQDSLVTYDLIKKDSKGRRVLPKTEDEFEKLRKDMTKNPFFEKGIYARDPESGEISDFGIVIRMDTKKNMEHISNEIWDISESYDDIKVVSNGLPIVAIHMNEYIHNGLIGCLLPMFI